MKVVSITFNKSELSAVNATLIAVITGNSKSIIDSPLHYPEDLNSAIIKIAIALEKFK